MGAGAYLEALEACSVAEHFTTAVTPQHVARAALAMQEGEKDPRTLADRILWGIALVFLSDFEAMPLLRDVATALCDDPVAPADLARWFHLGLMMAAELYDDVSYCAWVDRVEKHGRQVGAWIMLQVVLLGRGRHEVRAGDWPPPK